MSIVIDSQLNKAILDFRSDRDWEQFHTFRTLSTAIVVEAAELVELSQWTRDFELDERINNVRGQIEDEIADLCILLSYLVHDLGIDVERVVRRKLKANNAKYPVEKFRGSSRKYDE